MNNKRCTIRDRKQAADLLAALDGCERRNEKHNKQVGNMSDSEVLQFLADQLGGPVEKNICRLDPLQVEEITPGGGSADIYEKAADVITNYMYKNNWDAEKITPLQWQACMLACGRYLRSWFRCEQTNGPIKGNYKKINIDRLEAAAPAWLELCAMYNKVPLISDFCFFAGVSDEFLYSANTGLTSDGMRFIEKLRKIQESGLNARILNSKESPVGAMFLQKCLSGYNETKTIEIKHISGGSGAVALPSFADDSENT